MNNLFKNSGKYAFSIIPLAAIILWVNFNKLPNKTAPVAGIATHSNAGAFAANPINRLADLPCGYQAKGPMLPAQKPTFVTNAYVPVLQYPAGNFPGTNVQIGNAIYSPGQTAQLILQDDGNLVLYCTTCNPVKPLWSSQTKGKDGKTLFFQADGDLVLRNSLGKSIWHSNIHSTCAGADQAYFSLQDDGNMLMLYNNDNQHAYLLGSTGSTNDQYKMSHPGKIQ
jgi:hypothetical protein